MLTGEYGNRSNNRWITKDQAVITGPDSDGEICIEISGGTDSTFLTQDEVKKIKKMFTKSFKGGIDGQ